MTRTKILDTSKSLICGDRAAQYGSPIVMFQQIADLWAGYLGVQITAKDAALMMSLMKIARAKQGKHDLDSYVDACGYLALAGEMAEKS